MTPRTLRNRLPHLLLIAIIALTPALTSCAREDGERLTVSGSTTLLPIAEIGGETFEEGNPGTRVLVSGVGSSAGIEDVAQGSSDIGTSSRDLKGEEESLGLVDTPVAFDGIAVIVNPSNPVSGLTTAQVRDIFMGRITNWKQVGGPDLEIGLVNRDEASGTREAFSKIVLDKQPFDPTAAVLPGTGQVRAVVSDSAGAVGYISLGFVTDEVKALEIDGVEPTAETVASKRYPVSRVLHLFTKGEPSGLAKRYIDHLLSPAVQDEVVRKAGFIAITEGRE